RLLFLFKLVMESSFGLRSSLTAIRIFFLCHDSFYFVAGCFKYFVDRMASGIVGGRCPAEVKK
ncbi:hypothetical protein, partial [uncultured Duncaniella sp.]|uniref:hypothetical protein n=1 Tax=uncultured Duncaniella sp. TaxID=2768039 RepID=UPI00265B5BB9